MAYKGIQKFPASFIAASQLEKNLIVTLVQSTQTVALAGDNEGSPFGVITARGAATTPFDVSVMPLSRMDGTYFVKLAGTVTKGDALICAASGEAKVQDGSETEIGYAREAGVDGDDIEVLEAPVLA